MFMIRSSLLAWLRHAARKPLGIHTVCLWYLILRISVPPSVPTWRYQALGSLDSLSLPSLTSVTPVPERKQLIPSHTILPFIP